MTIFEQFNNIGGQESGAFDIKSYRILEQYSITFCPIISF